MYIINDVTQNGYSVYFLDILSIFAIISGISVITSKNPVISILFLIALFFSMSTYLILIGMYFIGLSYLLVYVGAVSILFLFILMLINVRVSELSTNTGNSIPLAFIIVILFSYPIYKILPYNSDFTVNTLINNVYVFVSNMFILNTSTFSYNVTAIDATSVSFVSSKSWDNNLAEASHITALGNVVYTNYSLWLIVTSVILLLSMIGAIVITINTDYTKKT